LSSPELVEYILAQDRLTKEEIFACDKFGFTFVHYASMLVSTKPNVYFHSSGSESDVIPRIVTAALSQGFDINTKSLIGGYTPLAIIGTT